MLVICELACRQRFVPLGTTFVPRGWAPFVQHQESRPNFLGMCREFFLYYQPIRFVRLDSEPDLTLSIRRVTGSP